MESGRSASREQVRSCALRNNTHYACAVLRHLQWGEHPRDGRARTAARRQVVIRACLLSAVRRTTGRNHPAAAMARLTNVSEPAARPPDPAPSLPRRRAAPRPFAPLGQGPQPLCDARVSSRPGRRWPSPTTALPHRTPSVEMHTGDARLQGNHLPVTRLSRSARWNPRWPLPDHRHRDGSTLHVPTRGANWD